MINYNGLNTEKAMANKTRSWTDEQLVQAVSANNTIAGVLRSLGLAVGGYNSKYVTKHIVRLNLSTDHFLGRCFKRGSSPTSFTSTVTKVQLVDGTSGYTSSTALKNRLVKERLLDETCATCGIGTTWNEKPLTLQLDHINGNSQDNRLSNLRLLCPNCHSQTSTFCGRNSKGKHLTRQCKSPGCTTLLRANRAYCDLHAGYPTERGVK